MHPGNRIEHDISCQIRIVLHLQLVSKNIEQRFTVGTGVQMALVMLFYERL